MFDKKQHRRRDSRQLSPPHRDHHLARLRSRVGSQRQNPVRPHQILPVRLGLPRLVLGHWR